MGEPYFREVLSRFLAVAVALPEIGLILPGVVGGDRRKRPTGVPVLEIGQIDGTQSDGDLRPVKISGLQPWNTDPRAISAGGAEDELRQTPGRCGGDGQRVEAALFANDGCQQVGFDPGARGIRVDQLPIGNRVEQSSIGKRQKLLRQLFGHAIGEDLRKAKRLSVETRFRKQMAGGQGKGVVRDGKVLAYGWGHVLDDSEGEKNLVGPVDLGVPNGPLLSRYHLHLQKGTDSGAALHVAQ